MLFITAKPTCVKQLTQLKMGGNRPFQGLIVSKVSGSCLNQISGFEPEHDTKRIVSIIGPQNVGPLEPHFDPDM